MMPTQGLFLITVLYLIQRWILSLFNRQSSIKPLRVEEGEREGLLIHHTVKITQTLEGRPTDVTFHYVESATPDRDCIVFLHGFMDTWRLWKQALDVLSEDYHVIALDLKGCGQSSMNYPDGLFSDGERLGGNYQFTTQADEIVAALDAIGVHRFSLVTLDLGTIIGDLLAGKYRDRIIRYIRCQQPLVGHFRGAIPQGQFLRRKRSARWLTFLLEADISSLLRVLYGRTGWPILDQQMKRSYAPISDEKLHIAMSENSYSFQDGPRQGRPGTFACAWAGLYQHNQNYQQFILNNLQAYQQYSFPIFLFQGIHDIAMPPARFDGTTGMAFKVSRTLRGQEILRSRPFNEQGKGLGEGYEPWGNFIPNCHYPIKAESFFPQAPFVTLKFFDTGHFIPLENPELFIKYLAEALQTS